MILSFERFGTDGADVLALIAVRQLVLGQCARVIEALVADLTVSDLTQTAGPSRAGTRPVAAARWSAHFARSFLHPGAGSSRCGGTTAGAAGRTMALGTTGFRQTCPANITTHVII